MNRPRLVTITGIDRHTDLGRAKDLCARYPLEFALLGDPEREGRNPRVPTPDFAATLGRHLSPSELAIHLCGAYSDQAIRREAGALDALFGLSSVQRIQVNAAGYSDEDIAALVDVGRTTGCAIIIQNTAPEIPHVAGLFYLDDQSAGRGQIPVLRASPHKNYPAQGEAGLVGYAGGLAPENLADQLDKINAANPSVPYWIDAASGVRDDRNHLDLDKVERFLEIAFGS